ncbi:MAG: S-methyl-5-thioribose-1-phosphate isomerase, partial [Candidatus Eisenbacteria bacterium]|nr:S-methyl-5-thioribose-1-phosphate isomerase [Candidatus Eisenbacteria bacterium]
MIPTIEWHARGPRILDQTHLPSEERYVDLDDLDAVCEAILNLRIRGAPAIGIAGAYGLAHVAQQG